MTVPQLLLRWIVVASLTITSGLWRQKLCGKDLVVLAILAATMVTGIAALHPLTKLPGVLGMVVIWLRQFLIFTTLAGVIAGFPQRVSLIMGAGFATLLTMVQLLR